MSTLSSATRRQFLSGLFSITAAGLLSHRSNAIASSLPDHLLPVKTLNKVSPKQYMRRDEILPEEQQYVTKDHMEGFEKEELFHSILGDKTLQEINEKYGLRLNAAQLTRILKIINPEYFKDLFERRPCVRKLKYAGTCTSDGNVVNDDDDFLIGKIYESVAFNGGTYTIKRGDKLAIIGSAYFERVD